MMSRVLRPVLVVGAVTAALLGASASIASAAPQACPRTFFITDPAPGDEFGDRNGNGLICVSGVAGQGGNSVVPGFVVIDDRLD